MKAFVTDVQAVSDSTLQTAVNDIEQAVSTDFDFASASSLVGKALNEAIGAITDLNKLSDTFQSVYDSLRTDLDSANQAIATAKSLLKLPEQIRVSYDWETPLKSSSIFIASHLGQQSQLKLHSEFITRLDSPKLFTAYNQCKRD